MPRKNAMRCIALILALAGATMPLHAETLEERLAGLAAQAERVLHYEEQRESRLLRTPVTVRGRLEYEPDTGRLTKWVDSPRPARLTITADGLEAETGGRTRRLPLEQRPELAALLEGVRALLAGDTAALEDRFRTSYLEGEADAWVLHLEPRQAALAARLRLLEVRGAGDRVTAIDTVDEAGRRQRMNIVPPGAHAP